MKKILLLLFIGITSSTSFFAQQDKAIEKLKMLYADEEYQDCAHDAIALSAIKKHKNKPAIYIYASMSCLRIFQENDMKITFKKSFTDALSYAGKYRKKDKDGLLYPDYIAHFEELKSLVTEEIENFLLEERKAKIYKSAKKSLGLMKKINKMDPDDKGAILLRGLLEIKSQNKMEGKKIIKEILPQLKTLKMTRDDIPKPKELTPEEKKALAKKRKKAKEKIFPGKKIRPFEEMSEMEQVNLRVGLIEYAEYLLKKKKVEEAQEVIEIGKPFFLNENEYYLRDYDIEYKKTYNKVMNG